MNRPDLLDQALEARLGGRPQEWAGGRNPFARPHPERPWVYRGLPERSRAGWLTMTHTGHIGRRNDFSVPPVIPGPKRLAVNRPERAGW